MKALSLVQAAPALIDALDYDAQLEIATHIAAEAKAAAERAAAEEKQKAAAAERAAAHCQCRVSEDENGLRKFVLCGMCHDWYL